MAKKTKQEIEKVNKDFSKLKKELIAKQSNTKERREWVMKELLEGKPTSKIYDEWDRRFAMSKHSFGKDVTFCYKTIKKYMVDDMDQLITSHLLQYDRNAAQAYDLGQINASTQALQAKEKLLKIHQDNNNTFIQNNLYKIDDSVGIEELKELLERYSKDDD